MPRPEEVAVLIVNGVEFRDWETVEVQHRWTEPYPVFQFTCSEKQPAPKVQALLAFKPGDLCTILLAGILAITGEITIRQVAYDARSHGVQLIGKGLSYTADKSSVRTKTNSFDNNTWEQVARKLLGSIGVGLEVVGTLDARPFEFLQLQPGEIIFKTLERLARNRGIILGSNHRGQIVAIGDHTSDVEDVLEEGVNILRANCTITNEYLHDQYFATGQSNGHDGLWGADASEIEASAGGSNERSSPLVTPMEQPGTQADAQRRAEFERRWHEGTQVKANVTVQGWLRNNGDLWRVGQSVWLRSPMLLLDMPLAIQMATFRQNNDTGTTTELELVLPWFLNDLIPLTEANPQIERPTGNTKNNPELPT